jgi:molybdopterin-binding protein
VVLGWSGCLEGIIAIHVKLPGNTALFRETEEMPMMNTGWTRTAVAAALHVTPRTLYNWEREGRIPAPERDSRGWRRYTEEQVAAMRRHLGMPVTPTPSGKEHRMELSARNNLRGTVRSLRMDSITAEVILDLGQGMEIVSIITRDSVERLGLKVGDSAVAIIKSTEVMIGK